MNAPVENEAIGENDDAILTQMLENVVDDGTGKRAALDDRPVAGKTGTTENYGDAWFVGYTPQLAVAVWVGYPNKLVSMENQFEGGPVAGGTYPAVIWNSFVKRALRRMDEEPEGFPVPTYGSISPVQVVYRDNQWLVDNGNCRTTREVLYVTGFEPDKRAQCKPNEVDVPPVVGMTIDEAETRLYGMPLTPELITRPAKTGERVGVIVEQFPKSGDALDLVEGAHRDGAGDARTRSEARRADHPAGPQAPAEARVRAGDRRRWKPRRGGARRPRAASQAGPGRRQGNDDPPDVGPR